jgi:hypothetical protein
MAIFRKIHVSFWSDSFIGDLEKDRKLFYLYILTNERTTQCGIYEITKKQIAFDLGYTIDTVSKLLEYFIKCNKIRYNEHTKELAIRNWLKYNSSTSPKVQSCINKELTQVKDTLLIQYINSIDTQSQEEQEEEQEQEQEEEQEKENAKILNEFSRPFFDLKYINEKSLEMFDKLLKKYSEEQIKTAITNAKEDKFWSTNFLSPMKLVAKDKTGVSYIDVFLNLKPQPSQQVSQKRRMVHYEMNGFFYTHYEMAYNQNLQSLGADKVKFLNYVEDAN